MAFWGWYIDPLYLVIFGLTFIIAIATQLYMGSTYRKWSNVKNSASLTGGQVGSQIINRTKLGMNPEAIDTPLKTPELKKLAELRDEGIITPEEFTAKKKQIQKKRNYMVDSRIKLERTPGQLTDHYDPRSHTVRMSEDVAGKPSVASMAIVAHELGHAQQHENNSFLISVRSLLIPAVNFSSPLSYLCILFGFMFYIPGLFGLGIIFYAVMVLFTLVTLPVEFDASRRGLKLLDQSGLIQTDAEKSGSRQVLQAAGLTYVAAATTAILKLLYFLSLAARSRRR